MQLKHKLAMAVGVVAVCAISAQSASATTIRDSSNNIYSGALDGTTTTSSTLSTSWGGTITCAHSHITGTVNGAGPTPTGTITNASWGSTTTVDANGMLNNNCTSSLGAACTAQTPVTSVSWGATVTSTTSVTFSNTAVQVSCPTIGLTCSYGGTVTGTITNGSPSTIKFTNVSVAVVAGSFGCGTSGTWNATYDVWGTSGGTAIDVHTSAT